MFVDFLSSCVIIKSNILVLDMASKFQVSSRMHKPVVKNARIMRIKARIRFDNDKFQKVYEMVNKKSEV